MECLNYQHQTSGLGCMDGLSPPEGKQMTEYMSGMLTMQDYIIMLCHALMLYSALTHCLIMASFSISQAV